MVARSSRSARSSELRGRCAVSEQRLFSSFNFRASYAVSEGEEHRALELDALKMNQDLIHLIQPHRAHFMFKVTP